MISRVLGVCFFSFLIWTGIILAENDPSGPDLSPVTARGVKGRCTVLVGGSDVEVTVQEGHTYPVGSVFKVSKGASLALEVTPGCVCHLSEGSEVSIQPAREGAGRTVVLASGQAQLTSTGEGPVVGVRTPAGVCSAPQGSIICSVSHEDGKAKTDIEVVDGTGHINGGLYDVPNLGQGTAVSMTSSERELALLVKSGAASLVVSGVDGQEARREVSEGGMMLLGWEKKQQIDEQRAEYAVFVGPESSEAPKGSWQEITVSEETLAAQRANLTEVNLEMKDVQRVYVEMSPEKFTDVQVVQAENVQRVYVDTISPEALVVTQQLVVVDAYFGQ